jgi:putative superfamily III holin-X
MAEPSSSSTDARADLEPSPAVNPIRDAFILLEAPVRAPVEETQTSNGHRSGDLVSDVVRDAQKLVGLEIALGKQELKELVTAYAITAGMPAVGGLLLVLAVLVAVPTFAVMFPGTGRWPLFGLLATLSSASRCS